MPPADAASDIDPGAIPTRILLGPHVWRVLTDPDTSAYLSHCADRGTTDAQSLTIRVEASTQAADSAANTLLHELLHACWETSGLAVHDANDHQEQVIASLAPQVLHLLRANPELVRYLTADQDAR